MFAHITSSERGFPRIIHENYSYGRRSTAIAKNETIVWVCTGCQSGSRKRCLAAVQTKVIDGLVMMCFRNQNHICTKRETE